MEELADRERLFQKKQYREEMRRRREMKKRAAQMSKEELAQPDDADDEAGKAAAVPVPMPDMALPPSFDSDNPTHRYSLIQSLLDLLLSKHVFFYPTSLSWIAILFLNILFLMRLSMCRYRYLETANQWLVRPVLETHGWDHDAGYDGFNVEKMFVVKDKIPASISGQVTKDKKEAQVNFEAAASLKHGEGKVTLTGFDIQTIGKDLAYTLRAETRFNNFKRNKTTAGVTCTVLNDTVAAGLKLEDRILIGRRIKMVVNGGVLTGKGDKAFGGSLEATLRGKDYPLSRTLSTLGLSVMDWHGDLAIGGNLQSQFLVGKTMLVGRANLNNRGSGQVSIRASSSEQLQMVLIGIVPILRSLINCRFGFGQPSQ
jgi:Toc86/159 family protein import component